jgi:hypothetical protein
MTGLNESSLKKEQLKRIVNGITEFMYVLKIQISINQLHINL